MERVGFECGLAEGAGGKVVVVLLRGSTQVGEVLMGTPT